MAVSFLAMVDSFSGGVEFLSSEINSSLYELEYCLYPFVSQNSRNPLQTETSYLIIRS